MTEIIVSVLIASVIVALLILVVAPIGCVVLDEGVFDRIVEWWRDKLLRKED